MFATPGHEEALLQLVRCLLPDKDIVSVQLSAQEQMSDTEKLRRGIYDVSCQTAAGDYLEIEMQVRKQNDCKHPVNHVFSAKPCHDIFAATKQSDYVEQRRSG